MPWLPPSEDPRFVEHWLAHKPEVPIIVDSGAENVSDLHLRLASLSAKKFGGTKRTRSSYLLGRAHPTPLPCTALFSDERTVALVNAATLHSFPSDQDHGNNRWCALLRASAVLWSARPDDDRGRDIVALAKAFDVPTAIAWSEDGQEERLRQVLREEGYADPIVVTGALERAAESLLDRFTTLPKRSVPQPERPLQLLASSSGPWGLTVGRTVVRGVVLGGRPVVGQAVVAKTVDGATVHSEIVEVPSRFLLPNEEVFAAQIVLKLTYGAAIRWVCDAGHASTAGERLDACVRSTATGERTPPRR